MKDPLQEDSVSRFFSPIPENDFRAKIRAMLIKHPELLGEYSPTELAGMSDEYLASAAFTFGCFTAKVHRDLEKIEFDFENCYSDESEVEHCEPDEAKFIGIKTLPNGMTYLGFFAGGDWEVPIRFIVYYDGKGFRGYVPTEGNPWNLATKTAYGSEPDGVHIDDSLQRKFDYAAVIADIQDRIKARV